MSELRIATRASALALAQARWVGAALEAAHPGLTTTLVEVTTSGDRDQASPVAALTEVGAFVRAVQRAVLDGAADVAVHSCKDLPVAGPDELTAVYPTREAPWDVLCGSTLDDLSEGARVGTGSPRRAAQLRRLRPDLEIAEIRGNVDTRLGKVAAGEYAAVVLAEAGLRRLGRTDEIATRFGLDTMVPAPAQAALAVEAVRSSSAADAATALDDPTTRTTVEAERALLAITGAGCRAALGAHAAVDQDGVVLTGFVSDADGARRGAVTAADPESAALRLAHHLELVR